MGTPADGRALVAAAFEAFNGHDVERLDDLFAEGYAHDAPIPPGRESFKGFMRAVFAAFPDLEGTIDELVCEDGRVACASTWRGTHSGDFMGLAASGRSVEYRAIEIFRIEDGRIAGHRQQTDTLALLTQLGALPELDVPAGA
jgi:steroid delta-isomerase-like uncharacterized protein